MQNFMSQLFTLLDLQNFLSMIVIMLISLPFHEFAHAFTANLMGDPTAKYAGRLTLNPIRHLDLLGTICMLIARFGWAKPVPVNPNNFKNPRAGMAVTALAGPVSNMLLAFVAELFFIKMHTQSGTWNYTFLILFIIVNIGLAVFNLIPINPLDGSRILAFFLPERAADFFGRYEQYTMIIIFVLMMTGRLSGPMFYLDKVIFYAFANFINILPF